MEPEKQVFIIEEVRSRREHIVFILQNLPGFRIVGQVSSIEEAMAKKDGPKPDIILLDAELPEMADGRPIEKVLATFPSSIVICTKEEWTETAAMHVLRNGAKGYISKHFTNDEFLQVVVASAEISGEHPGKIIALFSPKAGCGKTTLAANLAVGLAEQTQLKIGVVDANLSFGDMALFYNLHPKTTIVEAVRDLQYLSPATLGAYLTSYQRFVRLLASPSKPEKAELVHSGDISTILTMMKSSFRYVIVDTSPGFNEISLAACDAAECVYIITALNTGCEVDHLRGAIDTFKSLGYERGKLKVVVSRVPSRDIDLLKRLEDQLSYPVTALLPNDFRLAASAANKGKPLLLTNPASALAKGITDVVRDIGIEDVVVPKTTVHRNPLFKLLGRG